MPEIVTRRTLKSSTLVRDFALDTRGIDKDARTVPLAFSSETPVERWFGLEILDHSPGAVDLSRLNDGGAFLMDHNSRDQIGVVESASVGSDKIGRAVVRFGKSVRAEEMFQDVLDGIRTKVSVGYQIQEMVHTEKKDGDEYLATKWTPLEISLVSIPADTSVGVGRSQGEGIYEITVIEKREETPMPTDTPTATPPATSIDVEGVRVEAIKGEQMRIREITALGARANCAKDAQKFIEEGKSIEAFREHVLMNVWRPSKGDALRETPADPSIGMSGKDVARYSILRAMAASLSGDWSKAGLEREASAAALQARGQGAEMRGSFIVPHDVLMSRDYLSVGLTSHTGEKTVATDLMAGDFITLLRNNMVTHTLGARTLSGLVGDIAIPRMTGGASTYWLTEDANVTGTLQAFDQITMTPKTVGAMTELTRKLIQQSSMDVEALVRSDLATAIALAIDLAAFYGTGSAGQPKGVANQSGIGAVIGGTNGAAPTWDHIVNLETAVAVANAAVGNLSYVTNPAVRGKLKRTFFNSTGSDTPLWSADGSLNGYPTAVTSQIPSNLTKGTSVGVCSAILFGNWADLLIGLWGGLDVLVDPYTGSQSGRIRIVSFQDCDLNIRHPQSFAMMNDALTV